MGGQSVVLLEIAEARLGAAERVRRDPAEFVALLRRFAKPVVLPARAGLYVDRTAEGWELTLRNLAKGYPHLSGTVTAL